MVPPRMLLVRIRLCNGETVEAYAVTVGAAVAEYPWPLATAWEVVPDAKAGR